MDTEIKTLAKQLLIVKMETHIKSHATGMPQKSVIEQWYNECVEVATSIVEVTA